MKKLLLVVCFLCFAFVAYAQEASDAEAKVFALENIWNQAELHVDAHAIDSLMSKDFVLTSFDGTVQNKSEYLATVRDKDYHPQTLASSNMKFHVYGNTAIVQGDYHEKGMSKGKPFEVKGRFTDTWINQNGSWICVASALTPTAK